MFDIKFGDKFCRKLRYYYGGHKTGLSSLLNNNTVVTQYSVRILILKEALNNLLILGVDINNAFLTYLNWGK